MLKKNPQNHNLPLVIISLLWVIGSVAAIAATKTSAERLESESYVIQFGNFNVTSGEKSSASYNVTDTVGQTGAGPYGEYGSSSYFVGSGFQYIYQIDTFAFSISDLSIDLGELSLNTLTSDTNVLTITTRGAGGYTVYAYELHPLRKGGVGGTTIADTVCDNSLCDETDAEIWVTGTVPGFGFNATGTTVPSDFVDGTYFRQFADDSAAETMQAVMSSSTIASDDTATVTYQAAVNSSQEAGLYTTDIVYVAVPGY